MLEASFFKKTFHFNFRARTSRGLMKDKTSWFIKVWDSANPAVFGLGECGPLPGLSIDATPEFENVLQDVVTRLRSVQRLGDDAIDLLPRMVPPGFPSIRMGIETAVRDLVHGGNRIIFKNSFLRGQPIAINGLIWMDDMDIMLQQITDKIAQGYTCIKIKVGGLNFERECDILHYVRKKYFRDQITIRLDANGAFKTDDVLFKLTELSRFQIHSIEQPLKPGNEALEALCRKTPIPIALDEELIGVDAYEDKRKLLQRIKPQFITLKPTLHGGFLGCEQWINAANEEGIGWWITSALESNIGLNAICQFAGNFQHSIPQGLGTGLLYSDNFESPLETNRGTIFLNTKAQWLLDENSLIN
jgi:L-alanine-DL-glutamate epimerase-like enolase superfamily enzyme